MTDPLRVVVADDAVLLREGLASLLADHGMHVVARAGDPDTLLGHVRRHRPDLALVDIRMPPTHTLEGLEAARTIRAELPDVAILVLSQYLETRYAVDLFADDPHGLGYLLKQRVQNVPMFIEAIQRVVAGSCVIDPEIVSLLLDKPRRNDPLAALTDRERQVLQLMAEGRSNQGIVERLTISGRTVESHVSSILTKLGIEGQPDDHRRVLAVLAYLRPAPQPSRLHPISPSGDNRSRAKQAPRASREAG